MTYKFHDCKSTHFAARSSVIHDVRSGSPVELACAKIDHGVKWHGCESWWNHRMSPAPPAQYFYQSGVRLKRISVSASANCAESVSLIRNRLGPLGVCGKLYFATAEIAGTIGSRRRRNPGVVMGRERFAVGITDERGAIVYLSRERLAEVLSFGEKVNHWRNASWSAGGIQMRTHGCRNRFRLLDRDGAATATQ